MASKSSVTGQGAATTQKEDAGPPSPQKLHKVLQDDTPGILRDVLRPRLLPYVYSSSQTTIEAVQRFCGVMPPAIDTKDLTKSMTASQVNAETISEAWEDPSQPLYFRAFSLFCAFLGRFGSFLGGELFYITFFPFLFWNIDARLGRRIIVAWVMTMFVGQSIKDHVKLPRPAVCNPRVRPMEGLWLAEYGFPSTHVMSVFAQAAMTVYYTWREDYAGRHDYPLHVGVGIAAAIVGLVAFARVYMGVHSIPDLVGGIFFAGVICLKLTLYEKELDEYVISSLHTLYIPAIVCTLALMAYPRPNRWTTAYGDTAVILGVGNGVLFGSYLSTQAGYDGLLLPWLGYPFYLWFAVAMSRAVIGYLLLGVVRSVMKKASLALLLRLSAASDVPPEKRYAIGIPTKFLTYSCVGFAAVCVMPFIYDQLGVNSQLLAYLAA